MKTMLPRTILLPLLLLAPLPALAQQTDEQLWLQANGTTGIDVGTSLTLESIARFGDAADGLAHTEFGALLTRKLGARVKISAGYRHVQDYDHGRQVPNEERLRQMIDFDWGSGISSRLRLEQHFSSAGPQVAVRIRSRVGIEMPLGETAPSLFAAHESFVNLNATDWGQRGGYDRMRHTIGLSVPLIAGVDADVGYLNEYRFGRSGSRDRMMHAATVTLGIGF